MPSGTSLSVGSFAAGGEQRGRTGQLLSDLRSDGDEQPFARRLHLRGRLLLVRILHLDEIGALPDVRSASSERGRAARLELARRGFDRIAVGDDPLGEHAVGALGGGELRQVDLDGSG